MNILFQSERCGYAGDSLLCLLHPRAGENWPTWAARVKSQSAPATAAIPWEPMPPDPVQTQQGFDIAKNDDRQRRRIYGLRLLREVR